MNRSKHSHHAHFARFLLVLYVFVSFFSFHFHQHTDSGALSPYIAYNQAEDNPHHPIDSDHHDTEHDETSSNDCLSCFYFQHQHAIQALSFSFIPLQGWDYSQQVFSYLLPCIAYAHSFQLLRGPPMG